MGTELDQMKAQIAGLQSQLNAVQNLLRQKLIGNDPSTNFVQYLQLGQTQIGWFGMFNNGVVTLLNSQPSEALGNGQVQSVRSQDQSVAKGDYSYMSPTIFALAKWNGVNYTLRASIGETAGAGGIRLLNGANGYTVTIDTAGAGNTIWDDLIQQTIINASGISTPALFITGLGDVAALINSILTRIGTPHTHGPGSFDAGGTPVTGTSDGTAL